MTLMVLGVNYQTAPIHVRERLTMGVDETLERMLYLIQTKIVLEVVLLSTCHRIEIYCKCNDSAGLWAWMMHQGGLTFEEMQCCYFFSNAEAVKHLMRVASGLDSMVLGEVEILGQIKSAYTLATNAGTVGKYLGRCFQTTFAAAKQVRSNTGIGVNPVSIAYAAIRLSQQLFTDLSKTTVLLIGAGDLIRLAARHLKTLGVKKMMIANRTLANAERLANEFQGEAFSLAEVPACLKDADIVVTGTMSSKPLIGKDLLEQVIRLRKRRPMFMVDLSVPRNVEPEASDLEDIYLYCVDDLENLVEDNRRLRRQAAEQGERIIQIEADCFMGWIQAQDSFKVVCQFRHKYETLRDKVLQDAFERLKLGESPETVMQRLALRLTNRFLHSPTRFMRKSGFEKDEKNLELMCKMFELKYETIDTE